MPMAKERKKRRTAKKKEKRRKGKEDVVSSESSESSSSGSSSSSSSSSDSEGEDNSALTKAKAMLKFRETFQKRLEQRERAGKSNVTELFDSSVPLDIEDLKAEFDNAPAPTFDEEYYRENNRRRSQKNQDFSNVTVGKLPAKGGGVTMKGKPEKLVNQFFNKDLVNPKPKSSIKIGLISTKVKKSTVESGLDVCPVTPPEGYPRHDGGKGGKGGPRVIEQLAVPDPEPTIVNLPTEEGSQQDNQRKEEEMMEGQEEFLEDGETGTTAEGREGQSRVPLTASGPPVPLPPANYSSAPVKRDPVLTPTPLPEPPRKEPEISTGHVRTRPSRFDQPPPTSTSREETNYHQAIPTIQTSAPSKLPPSYDPSKIPPSYDPSKIPPLYDPSKGPSGYDPSKMVPHYDPGEMPPTYDPSKIPPTYDPSKIMPPMHFDPSRLPPVFDPTKMPPFPFPPVRPPHLFDSRFPHPMMGPPPPSALFRPPTMPPYPPVPESRGHHHYSEHRSYDRRRSDRESEWGTDRRESERRDSERRESERRESERRESERRDSDRRESERRERSSERGGEGGERSERGGERSERGGYHHPPPDPLLAGRAASYRTSEGRPSPKKLNGHHHHHHHHTSAPVPTKSPTTPEIDPRAVREALKLLQGSNDLDDDAIRKALKDIKKSYSAAPTQYGEKRSKKDSPTAITQHEAEKLVEEQQEKQQKEQQELEKEEEMETSGGPLPAGPEIPETGLPDVPDTRPAADLAETAWQVAPSKNKGSSATTASDSGYQFPPPDQNKDYDYSEYYMHYYQQAYQNWQSERVKPIESRFPVSQGYGHKRALEKGGAVRGSGRAILVNKEEIQALVHKRKKIAHEMVKNPESAELMDKMEAVQARLNECGVTDSEIGMLETSQMSSAWKKRRQEDSDSPAWTRPDMFFGLPLVRSTIGMAILKKHGWVVGQVLGRGCPYGSAYGAGSLAPLEIPIKTDGAGLISAEERAQINARKFAEVMPSVVTGPITAPRTTLTGKHPVAALADVCHKRKWKQPEYTLIKEGGSAHAKLYFFQVSVKIGNFTTPNGAKNKRKAKADAAAACLERLGLMTSQLPPG